MDLAMNAAPALDAHNRAFSDDDGEHVQLAMVRPPARRRVLCVRLRDASLRESCAETPAIAALMEDLPHAMHARAGAIQLQRDRS